MDDLDISFEEIINIRRRKALKKIKTILSDITLTDREVFKMISEICYLFEEVEYTHENEQR